MILGCSALTSPHSSASAFCSWVPAEPFLEPMLIVQRHPNLQYLLLFYIPNPLPTIQVSCYGSVLSCNLLA